MSGVNFDRKYMQFQIKDHEQVLQQFRNAETQTKNAGVRRFTMETYPILEEHLALAKAVDSSLSEASRRAAR